MEKPRIIHGGLCRQGGHYCEGGWGRTIVCEAMAPAKAMRTHQARFTTPPSRRLRPMPPSAHWRPLANRSDSSFIARTKISRCKVCQRSSAQLQVHRLSRASVYTPTIRHRSRGRCITTDGGTPGSMTELLRQDQARAGEDNAAAPPLAPDKIDKSQLAIAEPKRLRDKAHLKLVASQPCLVCGRQPSDPHHLRFAQPWAIGLKVSDEFTVPLCRGHHRQIHQSGNEVAWWKDLRINSLEIARGLWEQTHPA